MNFRKHKIFILSFLSICLLSGNLIYVFQNFELIKHKKNQQKSNEISATLKLTIQDWIGFGGEEKVNLKEINFKTMESKVLRNLYFAGEITNIDAITGGFNFQNAWTSGFILSNAIT